MITRRVAGAAAWALSAVGCSPLAVFEAVAPKDAGARKVASGLAFGTHPRQTIDVHAPAAPGGPRPVAVFFYGGSWKSGSKEEYAFVGAALAARGFVTVIPDYRLHPEVRFPHFLSDGAAAIRWASLNGARFGGDGGRIVLAGHSAGAYNAAMLALDERYMRRAGVPPGTVRAFAGLSGPYDFLPLDPGTAQEVFGAAPDLRATQPISFASASSPPAFLATGEQDGTVRPRNTAALAARLRALGVPTVERRYPNLDHVDTLLALSVPFRSRGPVLEEMSGFLLERAT